MRILLSADPFLPVPPEQYGGIERIIDGLVSAYRDTGHQVALLAHPDSSSTVDQFFPWPGQPGQAHLFLHLQGARIAVASFQPDIWHSFSRLAYMFPYLNSNLPKVMSYQRRTGGATVKLASKIAKNMKFTGCSEHIAAQGRQAGGEWTAIPNFINPNQFTFVPSVPENAPLVFLGRIEHIKGVDLAIQIAQATKRKLIIAGNIPSGNRHQNYFNTQIKPHLIPEQIEYIGAVNDQQKNELLGSAAALISPIQWDEPFGIVFIEALACGTPVISCARGALPEIINSPEIGCLITTLESGIHAATRIENFDRNKCRQHVLDHFTAPKISAEYIKYYETLIQP